MEALKVLIEDNYGILVLSAVVVLAVMVPVLMAISLPAESRVILVKQDVPYEVEHVDQPDTGGH